MVVRVHVYKYNITMVPLVSQKRLEIQALRCNGDTSGRCQHRRHHDMLQLRFQLDSDVCSADLHHNPRKHMGLHDTSACIASLRTVSVVVRVCGFHGWSSWLGTCSPGSGAVSTNGTRVPKKRGTWYHGTKWLR